MKSNSPLYRLVTDLSEVAKHFGIMAANEPPPVKKLYHYQCLNPDYLKDILVQNRLHLSNPGSFNDPWDCRPYFEPTTGDESIRHEWGALFDEAYQPSPSPTCTINGTSKPWHNNEELLRGAIGQLTEQMRNLLIDRWRIYCLTPHPDSVLMWAHYADGHRGVCLEFDVDEPPIQSAHRVVYREVFQAIDPALFQKKNALTEAILLTKSADWGYEDEYRILARDGAIDPSFSVPAREGYLPLPPTALSAIVLGCSADVDSVRRIVDESRPGLPLKQAVRVPGKYHLQVRAI